MGPHFKPEVSHQGPPWTLGTYACRWAENGWTVPCQREPGLQTGLPCYPQYEVTPRGVLWWTCCSSSYTYLGLNPGDLALLKNRQSSTLQTAWCAVLCTTLLYRSWCTGVFGMVGNAWWASLAEDSAWGCGMPVVHSSDRSTAANAWASPSQGTSLGLEHWLLDLSSPALTYQAKIWIFCLKSRPWSVQVPVDTAVSCSPVLEWRFWALIKSRSITLQILKLWFIIKPLINLWFANTTVSTFLEISRNIDCSEGPTEYPD